MQKNKTIVIAGNPNCGKTVIFNALTGSRQKIGNWSGVTVEKKSGYFTVENQHYEIVDLPGTYSLSVISDNSGIDECIACEYLLSSQPHAIINVVDASNLERQLYLTTQLLEMKLPVIIALNMMDIAKRRGINIDIQQLSQSLGCPIIPLTAVRGKGINELRHALLKQPQATSPLQYDLEPLLQKSWQKLSKKLNTKASAHWLALRLLEDDRLAKNYVSTEEQTYAKSLRDALCSQLGEETDLLIADARYRLIQTLLKQSIQTQTQSKTFTSSLDRFILNRWLGIPIFLLVMYALFLFAINVGGAFQDFFDKGSTAIFIHGTITLLNQFHLPAWLVALVANGFGKGINTTISFIPVIGAMFLFLSLLEDSGYMARAAFVVDRLMAAIGLPGKAFVPLIVGFGCNVPTIMATRTLSSPRDRILTTMMAPFMSCGARLTVYVLFVAAFFPQRGALIIFTLYIIGIITAILTAFLLGSTRLKAESTPMILELPAYHLPHWGTILLSTWQRLKLFLFKAGRFIIPVCMLIGFLNAVSIHGKLISGEANQSSLLSSIGKTVTPLFYPIGIQKDNWPATVGLASGLLAKEVVVGTLNTLYSQVGHLSQEEEKSNIIGELKEAVLSVPNNLSELGKSVLNPMASKMETPEATPGVFGIMSTFFAGKIGAFAYLLFILLYFPCISTMAVMQREIGKGWAYFSMAWSTGIAYGVATLFYQAATFTHHPVQSSLWFSIIGIILFSTIWILRHKTKTSVLPLASTNKTKTAACVSGSCHG
ncbi:MAG: Fe(2+) transporter permease subunit FeoB [Rickettsiella sp.]|nr:Fe(2+) transporter permease subunit FeoB [Rickettsiella sp.]